MNQVLKVRFRGLGFSSGGPILPGRYRSLDYGHLQEPAEDALCLFARLNAQATSTGTGQNIPSQIACNRKRFIWSRGGSCFLG
jgi:hypothetical protein